MMNQINTLNNGEYYYLCDSNGEIIYHPRQIQISAVTSGSSIIKRMASGVKCPRLIKKLSFISTEAFPPFPHR